MNKLQEFAKQHFGIELTEYQLKVIEAAADGKVLLTPRRYGLTTANKVIRAYLKDSLTAHPKASTKGIKGGENE